ncbi:hypothetical protein GRF29_112g1359810 [Pseudopithomyces chartarum]|uniref:Inositol-phosphate phosphatase n=1 Tax=Pseudopithomyces chartarum TaxID=1892770 RepID=A0AAN6LRZ5_9PLEO|nr:hypothetical protein GRF29_112g1359810 [Pseudopithomyces chartarum]
MASLPQDHLDEIYTFAIHLGKSAGRMLQDAASLRMTNPSTSPSNTPLEKENAVDLVTETDENVEHYIKSQIAQKYPDHKFVGEESYSKGASREYLIDDSPTWCVDPLDGTVNYIHLFPMFCVSIAFLYRSKPIIGVIYAPFLNQFFSSDVAAGIAILLEAGGLATTANPPYPNEDTAPIEEVRLGSRFYLAIRPAGDSPTETGRQGQERTVREVWKRVRNLEYARPGG